MAVMESGCSCYLVRKKFNMNDNLKRHMKSQHACGNKKHTDSKRMSEMDSQLSQFALWHPFTMMVAASSRRGRCRLSKLCLKTESSGFSCATAHHMDLWSATALAC